MHAPGEKVYFEWLLIQNRKEGGAKNPILEENIPTFLYTKSKIQTVELSHCEQWNKINPHGKSKVGEFKISLLKKEKVQKKKKRKKRR